MNNSDPFCTLCDRGFDEGDSVEVKILGPVRRVHGACWKELTGHKPLPNRGKVVLEAILELEEERGLVQWCVGVSLNGYATTPSPLDLCDFPKPLAYKPTTREEWHELIVGLLVDGRPRTFNAIWFELAGDMLRLSQEIGALDDLLSWRIVQWSTRCPTRFRLNPILPLLEVGREYPQKKGGSVIKILSIVGDPGAYRYAVEGAALGVKYEESEAELVGRLAL